jgi:hypothetical protein
VPANDVSTEDLSHSLSLFIIRLTAAPAQQFDDLLASGSVSQARPPNAKVTTRRVA